MPRLERWQTIADNGTADQRSAVAERQRADTAATAAADHFGHVEQARAIVQTVAEDIQQRAHQRVAGVVTKCLAAVFGPDAYEFHIRFEQKRGRTEARLVFTRDGMEIDPLLAAGGGVVDVAAFALRVSALMLSRPAVRRTVVLDEPFRFVSAEYRANVRSMMEGLAEDLDLQIIMVTHVTELETGKVIRIG